jgi:hypothetical protein
VIFGLKTNHLATLAPHALNDVWVSTIDWTFDTASDGCAFFSSWTKNFSQFFFKKIHFAKWTNSTDSSTTDAIEALS